MDSADLLLGPTRIQLMRHSDQGLARLIVEEQLVEEEHAR